MVIWLFAGGGQAEIGTSVGREGGLVEFLRKHYRRCLFERKTPIKIPPAPKVNKPVPAHGKTGTSLAQEIKERLRVSLTYDQPCDAILVLDDLDCRDSGRCRKRLLDAIDSVAGAQGIKRFVAFAAPELEAWLIADWDHSFAGHPDFKGARHVAMRHWLSTEGGVSFDEPETFGEYDADRDTCSEKLSNVIFESTVQGSHNAGRDPYSKSRHAPVMLPAIQPARVAERCPLFRELHRFLSDVCSGNP